MAVLVIVSYRTRVLTVFLRLIIWIFTCRLATAVLTLMGGFCHPQLMAQLRRAALVELGPHLHALLQGWILIHDSSPSPGVEKSLRLIMKAHAFFESRSVECAPSQEEEGRPFSYVFSGSHG